MFVTDKGNVSQAYLKESSGHKLLDDAALKYANQLKFKPARKSGQDKSVWMTWLVNYNLETAFFVPREYAEKVNNLFLQIEQASDEEKSALYKEILFTHEGYIIEMNKHPYNNYNEFLKLFVLPEVYEQWKFMWVKWPLKFVVYHDFILRYPDADEKTFAENMMLDLIKNDILRIRKLAREHTILLREKDVYLETIYKFLKKQYPEAIDDDLKEEAEEYVGKL